MNKVVNIGKKRKGVMNQIKRMIDASDMVKGVDFDIASFIVLDNELSAHSLGGYLDNSSNELFKHNKGKFADVANRLTEGKDIQFIAETQYIEDVNHRMFYSMKEEIDIDLATELGLGVVYHKNEYLIYCPFIDDDPEQIVHELVMLRIYTQLRNPKVVDVNLAQKFTNVEDVVISYILSNQKVIDKHMNKLYDILDL